MNDSSVSPERESLRITYIGLNYAPEPTGISLYARGLTEGLAAQGIRVSVVTGKPHYPEWRRMPIPAETYRVDQFRRVAHFIPKHPTMLSRSLMEISFGLSSTLSAWFRPDVLILTSPSMLASLIAQLRARMQGIPVIVWVQDLYTLSAAQTRSAGASSSIIGRFEKYLVRKADAVVTIHRRFSSFLSEEFGVSDNSCFVIRNWSHIQTRAQRDDVMRRSLGWGPEDIIVLHAGNMGAKQGLESVVAASERAAEQDSRVRFVLMGHGNQREKLERLNRGGRLQFIDPLPDSLFQTALASADILLVNELPGMTEMSVPSKLTTYFATGLPVLGAVDPGSVTAEELDASGGSFRVPPADPAALLEAAERIGNDPSANQRGLLNIAYRDATMSEDAAILAFSELLGSLTQS